MVFEAVATVVVSQYLLDWRQSTDDQVAHVAWQVFLHTHHVIAQGV